MINIIKLIPGWLCFQVEKANRWILHVRTPQNTSHELASACTHYCKTSQLKWRKLIYTSPWTGCFLALCKLQNTHVTKSRFALGLCCFCLMQLCAIFHISVTLCIYACMILLYAFNSRQSMLLCFLVFLKQVKVEHSGLGRGNQQQKHIVF